MTPLRKLPRTFSSAATSSGTSASSSSPVSGRRASARCRGCAASRAPARTCRAAAFSTSGRPTPGRAFELERRGAGEVVARRHLRTRAVRRRRVDRVPGLQGPVRPVHGLRAGRPLPEIRLTSSSSGACCTTCATRFWRSTTSGRSPGAWPRSRRRSATRRSRRLRGRAGGPVLPPRRARRRPLQLVLSHRRHAGGLVRLRRVQVTERLGAWPERGPERAMLRLSPTAGAAEYRSCSYERPLRCSAGLISLAGLGGAGRVVAAGAPGPSRRSGAAPRCARHGE